MYLRPLLHSLRRTPFTHASQLCRNSTVFLQPAVITSLSAPANSMNLIRLASSNTGQPKNATEEIYYGTLTPKIRAVKVFSLTTSVVGVSIQPMLIEQGSKLGGVPMVVFLCGFAGLFTFVTPLLLHFVTKKYVTHIAYDATSDEYTATTISFLLLKKKACEAAIFWKCIPHTRPLTFLSYFCAYSTSSRHQTSMCPMSPACSPRSR